MPVAVTKISILRSAAKTASRSFRASTSLSSLQGAIGAASEEKKNANKDKENSVSSSSEGDFILKEYLSSIKLRHSSPINVSISSEGLSNNTKERKSSTASSPTSLLAIVSDILKPDVAHDKDEVDHNLKVKSEDDGTLGGMLDFSLLSKISNHDLHVRRKSIAFEKKKRYFKRQGQIGRFGRLVKICAKTLGPDVAINLFGRMGHGTSLTEFTALVDTCLKTARSSNCEDLALEQICKVHQIFKVVKERGFKIDEEMYGQLLLYLIENKMVEEFFLFHEVIKDENNPRLSYYEMLLWIKVKNDTKFQELFRSAVSCDSAENSCIKESLILALAESNHKEELLVLLETLDITRVMSYASLERIFSSLGRFMLEPQLERFLLALKRSGTGSEKISSFICEYAVNMPNLLVEDVIMKLEALNAKFDVLSTTTQYERLVRFYCELLKVHEALVVVDGALQCGVTLSLRAFHMILDACDQSCEFYLVHEIFSRIYGHSLKPDNGTFRRGVFLCTRMKDFERAYQMIEEMKSMNLQPTTSIYNTILGGYFHEKNSLSAMKVLKQMEDESVEPDSTTFSFLISNSRSEKDVVKFYDRMIESGVHPTKQVFMALINAYASFGQIEKARQVLTDKRISGQDLNEIKNVLVGALASNGQFSVALEMYEEIKDAKCHVDPKTIKCLIEHLDTEDVLEKSLQLLDEMKDSLHWNSAFFSIMSCCIRFENLRCATDLLKRLKDRFIDSEIGISVMFDEVFCMFAEKEPTDMRFGLSLLEIAKEEIGIDPTRKSLDFLLSACVTARDSVSAFNVWKEYEAACFPHNVLSFMRMYQALWASGCKKSAEQLLKNVPRDDPDVCCFIKACKETYKEAVEDKERSKHWLQH